MHSILQDVIAVSNQPVKAPRKRTSKKPRASGSAS